MRRERGARLRAAMADKGTRRAHPAGQRQRLLRHRRDAGRSSDAGRGNVERPVAVVLADDEMPHLFTPFLADAAGELDLDDDHLHGPTYLDLDEGVELFAKALARAAPAERRRSPSTT